MSLSPVHHESGFAWSAAVAGRPSPQGGGDPLRRRSAPRPVSRGANCHPTIGLDWLRLTGPVSQLEQVSRLIEEWFGRWKPGKGRFFYGMSRRYRDGAEVHYDEDEDAVGHCCVELSGSVLQRLNADERVGLMRSIMSHGFRATRLDIAVDFMGTAGAVFEGVLRGCESGELVRCRTWRPVTEWTSRGECLGRMVSMGRRGDAGSGRFVRLYDKGLETGSLPLGEWERWEAEFSGDVASQVAMRLIDASGGWVTDAYAMAMGAVEFREANGQRLSRRPMVEWYAGLLGGVRPVAVTTRRRRPSLDRFAAWLRRCVAPTIEALVRESGHDLVEVWRDLAGGVELWEDVEARSIVWEYIESLGPECDELPPPGWWEPGCDG